MSYIPVLPRRRGCPITLPPRRPSGLDRTRQAFLCELHTCLQASLANATQEIEATRSTMDQLRRLAREVAQ